MPFGLTNMGASFCRLMEMCIGDQQYITLLFYLDYICIFAETANQMLDRIELVFSRLKEFNLKIKPQKVTLFSNKHHFSRAYSISRWHIAKSGKGSKNSPIRGSGGLSKMSNKMSKIELSRLGQDLFDFSGLTWAYPLTHPSTHR